jgi:hypothetical protein
MRQQLWMLLMTGADLAFLVAVVYVVKRPPSEGEPYGDKERRFLLTSMFVSLCFVIAAGVALFLP